jgi:hypothetical protein
MYYDGGVYKVGGKSERALSVKRIEDVRALNVLQCASAYANIYFDSSVTEQGVRESAHAAHKFRPKTKAEVCECPKASDVRSDLGPASVCYREDIKCNLGLSFITTVRRARGYSAGNKLKHVRDEGVFDLNREFRELVRRGIWREDQFAQFLMSKPGAHGDRARSIMNCLRDLAA